MSALESKSEEQSTVHKAWRLCGTGERSQKVENPRELNQIRKGNSKGKDDKEIEEATTSPVSWTMLSKDEIKHWNIEVEYFDKFNTLNVICQNEGFCNYKDSKEMIYENESEFDFRFHCHSQREARYVMNGSLFYDIIDNNKEIVRIYLSKGDLIVLPIGLFHRTILPLNCNKNECKMLVFKDDNNDRVLETYFLDEIESNTQQSKQTMMQLYKNIQKWKSETSQTMVNQSNEKNENIKSANGIGYVLGGRAKALASYPHARVVNGMIYVSGTSSRRPDNSHIGAIKGDNNKWNLDIRLQTRAVLENIKIILNQVGASLQHCVAMTVFLVDFKDYQGMNDVYNEYFDGETGPTRTTVAVARLPHPNLVIEIQTVAVMPVFKK